MQVGRNVPFSGQLFHGTPFPDGVVAFYVVKNLRVQNEKASTNSTSVTTWLFLKSCDSRLVNTEGSETAGWRYCRHRSQSSLLFVKSDEA